jgi:transposase
VPSDNNVIDQLPHDADVLQSMVRTLLVERDGEKKRADELYIRLLRMEIELARLKKWYYGPRADRLSSDTELAQMLLEFGESLDQKPVDVAALPASEKPEEQPRRVRRARGRRNIERFENLPITTHVYELSEAERAGNCCGELRKEIGADESWQVEYIPGRFERLHHVRKRYACAACDADGESPRIESAAKPAAAIEKGLAGPGLLSYIVTSKFADYLPLYRLEDIFKRQGFEIARSTQSLWCTDVADVVEPLYILMAARVRQSHLVATDDTTMPMQAKEKTANARMWVYVGDHNHPYNVFDFTLDRGRDGPKRFLHEFTGVLLADGYAGYNGVVAGNALTRAGCWAHLKRKFVDAEKSAPEIAAAAVEHVRALYAVEREANAMAHVGEENLAARDENDRAAMARLQLRCTRSAPITAALREKLLAWKEQLLPKHPMAEAINYALGQWVELTVFLADAAVPLDNNVSEREMKRIVLNRKNSLFVGNPRGGRTAAILSSLTSTCRRHAVNPQLYFTQLLTNLPMTLATDLAEWLPDRWKLRHEKTLAEIMAH